MAQIRVYIGHIRKIFLMCPTSGQRYVGLIRNFLMWRIMYHYSTVTLQASVRGFAASTMTSQVSCYLSNTQLVTEMTNYSLIQKVLLLLKLMVWRNSETTLTTVVNPSKMQVL